MTKFVILTGFFINQEDINRATSELTETFLNLAKSCIPTKLVTFRKNGRPWYNSEIKKTSRQRDRQKKIAIYSNKLKK